MKQPENLYELCEMTCEAITLQPKNYYQDNFAAPAIEVAISELGDEAAAKGEFCGTAFCRAGWMCAILDGAKANDPRYDHFSRMRYLLTSAGVEDREIATLFESYPEWLEDGGIRWGTKAYAHKGVAGLKKFMRTWEKELRAGKLDRKGRLVKE